jgi:hypothetical protein
MDTGQLMRIDNPYINKKLGYYICDNLEFDSKIRACIHAVENVKPVTWVFNNDAFKKYDWTVEPEETLDQLYDQRARQLREQYDYLILSYSGGADSHNILESFRRQGLHIDEIITNTMTKASAKAMTVDRNNKDAYNAPEAEFHLNAVDRLKEIQNAMPKTKITVKDCSDALFDELETAGDASWVLNKREGLNPAGMTRFNYLHFIDIRRQFDKDKKIGLIVGIEKPRTMINRGELLMAFSDRTTNMITVAEHLKEYPNATVEFFYWTPDCVKIMIKQGHVIKNWLDANPQHQAMWQTKTVTPEVYRTIHDPLLRSLLYTTWNNDWFQSKKAVFDWYSEFDQWFTDLYKGTKAHTIWQEGLDFVKTKLSPFTKTLPTNVVDGLMVVTHTYSLGPLKTLQPQSVWIR